MPVGGKLVLKGGLQVTSKGVEKVKKKKKKSKKEEDLTEEERKQLEEQSELLDAGMQRSGLLGACQTPACSPEAIFGALVHCFPAAPWRLLQRRQLPSACRLAGRTSKSLSWRWPKPRRAR